MSITYSVDLSKYNIGNFSELIMAIRNSSDRGEAVEGKRKAKGYKNSTEGSSDSGKMIV